MTIRRSVAPLVLAIAPGLLAHCSSNAPEATTTALPENLPAGATLTTPVMAKQFNPLRAAYLGPCPNNGAAPADVYEFRLFALPVTTLTGTLTSVRSILQSVLAAGPLGTAVLRVRSDATGQLK